LLVEAARGAGLESTAQDRYADRHRACSIRLSQDRRA
jgi:hypothetical protein